MPAPLRSWSESARDPDGGEWLVEVSVPYFDSSAQDEAVEHLVAVTRGCSIRRTAWSHRVHGEPAADALLAKAVAAIEAGWKPGEQPLSDRV